MTHSGKLRFAILALVASHLLFGNPICSAQEPRIAAAGPVVSVSLGYAYLNTEVPTASRFTENGVASSVAAQLTRRIGIKLEASYTRTYGLFGLDHHSDMLSYLGGPVFYPFRGKRFAVYTQALTGSARITGVIPQTKPNFLFAETNKLAWAIGPGLDTKLSSSTIFRVGVDYLHGSYFTPAQVIQSQANFRTIISLVHTFGGSR